MYDSILMGKYLAAYCERKGVSVNQTKLQKLLYILYGTCLVTQDKAILNETPKAWPYGPVFPRPQEKFAKDNDFCKQDIDKDEYKPLREDSDLNTTIDSIIATFGSWSARQLSEWSHNQGSPWSITLASNSMQYNAVISDEIIKEYFKKIIKTDGDAQI